MFRGYWNRPDADIEAFDGDWFRTGDAAYLDEDGFLFIVDRIKDMVIRGGENIGCGRVEAALVEHPIVVEACVDSVPDERLGEEVGATVYVSDELKDSDLREFLEIDSAHFSPSLFEFQQAPLPRIASGKVAKRVIQAAARQKLLGCRMSIKTRIRVWSLKSCLATMTAHVSSTSDDRLAVIKCAGFNHMRKNGISYIWISYDQNVWRVPISEADARRSEYDGHLSFTMTKWPRIWVFLARRLRARRLQSICTTVA